MLIYKFFQWVAPNKMIWLLACVFLQNLWSLSGTDLSSFELQAQVALQTFLKGPGCLPEMSLVLRNLQRAVPLRRVPLRQRMEIVRSILGVQKFDLGIICVDNKSIQHINRIYRDKNLPTDVLSFPFHEVKSIFLLPLSSLPSSVNFLC